jgi:hypothetical protein
VAKIRHIKTEFWWRSLLENLHLEETRRKQMDNIEMDLDKIGREDGKWVDSSQVHVRRRSLA